MLNLRHNEILTLIYIDSGAEKIENVISLWIVDISSRIAHVLNKLLHVALREQLGHDRVAVVVVEDVNLDHLLLARLL